MVKTGNSPYIVEIPSDEEREVTKAIVVHGSVSKLAVGLQEVSLKRKVEMSGIKAKKRIGIETSTVVQQDQIMKDTETPKFGLGSGSPR